MEKLGRPVSLTRELYSVPRESYLLPDIKPYHPEVDAINNLGDRLEAIVETQARADQEQLDAMTLQGELTRKQGEAVINLVAEVKGLRSDQRWPSRATIFIAFISVATLVAAILTYFKATSP